MDTEELTLEEKCENVMNIVVESRKRFGKMCKEYEEKTSLMENKILNLQIETISNYRFKSTNASTNIDVEDMCKATDDFAAQILERKHRIESLKKKIKDTQTVVAQLKQDRVNQKLHQPLTAAAMLAKAKEKQMDNK